MPHTLFLIARMPASVNARSPSLIESIGKAFQMEEATITIQYVSPKLEAMIVESLIHYWMGQGLTQDQATAAAQNALVRLRANVSDRTWCLLPSWELL